MSNWLIGQAIVEEEQQGRQHTEYGEHLLKNLAAKLKKDFGAGYSLANLKYMRQFYLSFPDLLNQMEIGHAARDQFDLSAKEEIFVAQMPSEKTWQPGQLHPNLSWTHYRTLIRVERTEARAFYEIGYRRCWAKCIRAK
jgi:predicted nuclease of restriction endonuclease-like (RecB) superfamily